MSKKKCFLIIIAIALSRNFTAQVLSNGKEKTTFQTSRAWSPSIDNRADVAIVYGVGGNPSDRSKRASFEERVNSWKERGYQVQFMTGIAWGEYQDYFTGKWDGKKHLDEGQVTQNGDTIWHGYMVPYIVPTLNYLKYMEEQHIKRVIDAGVDAIYLEEPEFWARSGYSDAFKREWQTYYGFGWRPPHESAENTYLSNKLKYHLYYRALKEVFEYAKAYGKTKGMNVKCYVPTHSLINYSQWQIVSPEASLASLSCVDGYIAQIWTGTSREPNYYDGVKKERVFENAFLEYGCMQSMTASTRRRIYFLTDPVEDWPRDWSDYKRNYQATFTAQLLYPKVDRYEVMPWPERIYEGLYNVSAKSKEKAKIPLSYSTQMQIMINALNKMPKSENKISGTASIGALMSNSLMFQGSPVYSDAEDPQLSDFYGQTLPLVKRGVPVNIVHMENLAYKESLKGIKVLLLTYSDMKPMTAESHVLLADWVKKGGILVYSSRDDDPFQSVQEWWNSGKNRYVRPSDELFEKMGIKAFPAEGEYPFGKGYVYVLRQDPKEYVMTKGGEEKLIHVISDVYRNKIKGESLDFKNNFYLRRGNYVLISVMNESVSDRPFVQKGLFVDLFDPNLPVISQKEVVPGEQSFLFDLQKIENKAKPQVVASACRVYDEKISSKNYGFLTKSPSHTINNMRIFLPRKPIECVLKDHEGNEVKASSFSWDAASKTIFLSFGNDPDGIYVSLKY